MPYATVGQHHQHALPNEYQANATGIVTMDMTDDVEEIVTSLKRQEVWIAVIAFLSQFAIKGANRFVFAQFFPENELTAWLLLMFGAPIAICSIGAGYFQKKLSAQLGRSFKDDLWGEVRALKDLNDPIAWTFHRTRNRWGRAVQFFFFSSLGGFISTLVF
ncbi:hypothetical protein HZ993_18565 [Rhodoferax sp. AJA081-3]|uniref:hypothetical protein n=1 Tax=Rhodoferax sp. AJA081-3 TaxID=2752316 RepID=UPI001AE06B75|nr:hypothetical protein [Rhodoferax sp. AJA081-3]QTN27275.1 hypothetical protein HZ993_18565 [Rhodoferax sp. AJA081-3]